MAGAHQAERHLLTQCGEEPCCFLLTLHHNVASGSLCVRRTGLGVGHMTATGAEEEGWCIRRCLWVQPAALCRFNAAGFWTHVRSQLYQPCSTTAASSLPCTHQGSFHVAGGISVGEGSPAVGSGGGCLLQAGREAAGPLAHLSEQTQ